MFTENQSRQLYAITATGSDVIAPTKIVSGTSGTYPTDLSAKSTGACQLVISPDGNEMYFNYKGPKDGIQRTDRIKKGNILYVNATAAADMKHKKKRVEVTLDSNVSATAVAGQEYILNIAISNYIAVGDDSIHYKYGVALATSTSASDLYKKLAISLAKNFDREPVKLVNIYLKNSGSDVEVSAKDTMTSLASNPTTATAIIIEEAEQPWRRGAAPQEFVNFTVNPSTIYVNSLDQIWGTVTDVTASNSNAIVNSKKVADMEWFFHKERGDQYGEVGFPNNIDTEYQINPDNTYGYSLVDIHYFTEGNSMNVGKSEKTITIASPAKASDPEEYLQKLIGAAAVTGDNPSAATGLYAFLEGTGVEIKFSTSWDAA